MASQKQKKPRRVGRPNLPKGDAKEKIVPVRFDADDLRLVTAAARVSNEVLSEWIRRTLRSAAEVEMFQRTLHEAMQIVLNGRPDHKATTSELSEEIERRGLYIRKDGAVARAQQVNARARKYPQLFDIDNAGSVRLVRNSSAN